MAWFKVDDGFHSSRKVLSIPKRHRFAAIGLWNIAGSWCADELTDGHVPAFMVKEWGPPPSAAQALVDAGLWDAESDGFAFRNWNEYQPSKKDVDAERAASRARMQEIRASRKQGKPRNHAAEGEVFGRTVPNGSESVRNPDPTRPDPTPSPNGEGEHPPTPFCGKHKGGTEENCRPCGNARRAWEAAGKPSTAPTKNAPLLPPLKGEGMCAQHAEYPLPCDRCAEEVAA